MLGGNAHEAPRPVPERKSNARLSASAAHEINTPSLSAGRLPCPPSRLGHSANAERANARVVQQQLGHADLRMLQRYAHVVREDQRIAVEQASQIFLRRSAANLQGKFIAHQLILW